MTGTDDVEAGPAAGGGMVGGDNDDPGHFDPFYIATTKNASVQTLKRWRVRFDAPSIIGYTVDCAAF